MAIEYSSFEGYSCLWCGKKYESMPKDKICANCKSTDILDGRLEMQYKADNKVAIIKISSKEVLESMKQGNIWFQAPKLYQDYNDGNIVGDKNECALLRITKMDNEQSKEKYLTLFKQITKEYNWIPRSFSVTEYYNDPQVDLYRLLCFYKLEMDKNNNYVNIVDERIKGFGEYFSIIVLDKLLMNLIPIFKSENINYGYKDVIYLYRDNYSGPYNPRCKFSDYLYQNEYRIILMSDKFATYKEKEPYKINRIKRMKYCISNPLPINLLFEKRNWDEWYNDDLAWGEIK